MPRIPRGSDHIERCSKAFCFYVSIWDTCAHPLSVKLKLENYWLFEYQFDEILTFWGWRFHFCCLKNHKNVLNTGKYHFKYSVVPLFSGRGPHFGIPGVWMGDVIKRSIFRRSINFGESIERIELFRSSNYESYVREHERNESLRQRRKEKRYRNRNWPWYNLLLCWCLQSRSIWNYRQWPG